MKLRPRWVKLKKKIGHSEEFLTNWEVKTWFVSGSIPAYSKKNHRQESNLRQPTTNLVSLQLDQRSLIHLQMHLNEFYINLQNALKHKLDVLKDNLNRN